MKELLEGLWKRLDYPKKNTEKDTQIFWITQSKVSSKTDLTKTKVIVLNKNKYLKKCQCSFANIKIVISETYYQEYMKIFQYLSDNKYRNNKSRPWIACPTKQSIRVERRPGQGLSVNYDKHNYRPHTIPHFVFTIPNNTYKELQLTNKITRLFHLNSLLAIDRLCEWFYSHC